MVFLNHVESMVAEMKEVAKESGAISISFTSICGVEIHVTNPMFARIQGSEYEIDAFLSGDYPFRAKKSFGGATWFTLIKGEKVRPFVEDGLPAVERHRVVGTYLDSLRTKEVTASVGADAVINR